MVNTYSNNIATGIIIICTLLPHVCIDPTRVYTLNKLPSRRQSYGCFFSAGTYGGGGGSAFNELLDNCGAIIKRINIRAAWYVDAIQITYRLSNGQDYTAGYHGANGGTGYLINIDINNGEKIIGIFGKNATYVDQLGFITNKGRIFGPYGDCGGDNFHVNSCHIRGIFGRSAAFLDSIGFQCSHL